VVPATVLQVVLAVVNIVFLLGRFETSEAMWKPVITDG